MNSAEYVSQEIQKLKNGGIPLSDCDAAWQAALLCVGWPYIFGDRGEYCTPEKRQAVYNKHGGESLIKKCQVLNKSKSSCSGCKWLPGGKRVRSYDCRGFTYWILLQIFGWKLMGTGCTQQWNTESNWKAKGEVADGIPQDVIVCLFYYKKDKNGKRTKTLEHTGLYYNGQTCECSNGVQHFTTLNKKWEVWGVPACVDGEIPEPTPTPTPDPGTEKPTLRRGDKGPYVSLLQTELIQRGYDVGSTGVDGDFGRATETAVKNFQTHNGLTADGIVGPLTWAALDNTEPSQLYTVHIPHLPLYKAEGLVKSYTGAYMTKEE